MKLYDEKICARAEKILSQLTLREKIGQMVMFNSRNVKMLREKYSYEEIAEKFPFGSFFSGCDVIGLVGKRMKGIDDVKTIYGEIPFTGKSPVDLKLDGFAMDAWDEIHYNCLEK